MSLSRWPWARSFYSFCTGRCLQSLPLLGLFLIGCWSAVELSAVSRLMHASAASSAAPNAQPVVTVSAANFEAGAIAPDSIVAAFGVSLATTSQTADTIPLPTSLGGTTLKLTDSNGVERLAPLFFVSPNQINYLIPAETATGAATITVQAGDGTISRGTLQVSRVAPAVFSANSDGRGAPAALLFRVRADGTQGYEALLDYNPATRRFFAKPIDFGPGERVFLILYLSGIRHAADPNGDGNLNETIHLLLGGNDLTPAYAGPASVFVGLDQLNVEIPRDLSGRGAVSLSVAAAGAVTSNATEIEVAALSGAAPPKIQDFGSTIVALAGEELSINGSDFALNPIENLARIVDSDGRAAEAQVRAATPTQLKVLVHFGAGTGTVLVRTPQGEGASPRPLAVRTSISGFLQDTARRPIKGATITIRGTDVTTRTNDEGSFVLPRIVSGPAIPTGEGIILDVDGTTAAATPPFAKDFRKMPVRPDRDNLYPGVIELRQVTGPGLSFGPSSNIDPVALSAQAQSRSIATDGVTFEVADIASVRFPDGSTSGTLRLTVLERERTPADLPVGHFSSTIVQLTPFGATITPGGKLIFPNRDGLPPNAQLTLFRFEQKERLDNGPPNPELGTFVPAGTATVSADGQRVETATGTVTVTSYYFVSALRPTTTFVGHVVESSGAPVRRAVVNARGQSTFTDGNGGFVLRNIPVLAANEQITIEASYLRPSGRVSRTQLRSSPVTAGGFQVLPDLALPPENRPPFIIAPPRLNANAGQESRFDFIIREPDSGQRIQVGVSGAAFASIIGGANEVYTLRIAPGANETGDYTLLLTVSDEQGASATQAVALKISRPSGPTAQDQAVTTDEGTAKMILLRASDAGAGQLNYVVVNQPAHGSLSGNAPNLLYTPVANYRGLDSFTFNVSNGMVESNTALVYVAVRPINHAPTLEVPGSQAMDAGQTVSFLVSARDVDIGDTLRFSANSLPPGATFVPLSTTTWQFSWTPLSFQVGGYNLNFKVEDNGLPQGSDTKNISLTVKAQELTKSKWAKTFALEGGSVTSFLANSSNLFAATRGGGIYLSTNQGQSWAPANQGLGSLAGSLDVFALAQNGARLFAGTGNGLFASDDNGRTWRLVEFGGVITYRLVASEGKVYVWSVGEWYSSDNGASWKRLRPDLPRFNGREADYAIIMASDGTFYTRSSVGPPYSLVLLRLRSGEQSWQRIEAGLPSNNDISAMLTFGKTLVVTFYDFREQKTKWFLSFDQGDHWESFDPGGTSYDQFQCLFVWQGKLFIGLSYSGLVSSTDNGRNWQKEHIGSFAYSPAINNLASLGSTIFASVRGYFDSAQEGVGVGVYRSTDGGRNWSEVNTGLTNGGSIPLLRASEKTIYASTNGSFITSDTDGQSWRRYPSGLATGGLAAGGDNLLACCGFRFENGRRINSLRLSTDRGQSWKEIDPQAANLEFPTKALAVDGDNLFVGQFGEAKVSNDLGRIWHSVSAGLPNNRDVTKLVISDTNVYAVTHGAGAFLPLSGIYLLANQGKAWTYIGPRPEIEIAQITAFAAAGTKLFAGTTDGRVYASLNHGQSWNVFDRGLPKEPLRDLVISGGAVFAATESGIFFSNDDGQNWQSFNLGLTDTRITALVRRGTSLFASTEGGSIFRLEANVQNWSEANTGLGNKFTNAIALSSNNLFVGSLGSGVFRSSNGGRTWLPPGAGLPPNANVTSFVTNETTVWAGLFSDGVYRSDDQGANWKAVNVGLSNKLVNKLFISGSVLYAGTDGGVFRSLDRGDNWAPINNGLSTLRVFSLAADNGVLYAGTDGGGVFKLRPSGESWTRVSSGLTSQSVTALFVKDGVLYAGTSGGGICSSRDGGENWTAVNNQLPATMNVYAFGASGKKVYAGSIYGVFVTEDEGKNWKQINAGLLDVYVTGLVVSADQLFASTARGGVFVSQLEHTPVRYRER
jgi:uncharacterized protein (TIGR03437 family)